MLSFPHGEIVVSADTARREATARGIPPLHELVLYVVHGALHLAGHDDKKPKQASRMRAAERRILNELGYGDVFGVALCELGEFVRGLSVLEGVHQRHPAEREVLIALTTLEQQHGMIDDALRHARKLLELTPTDPALLRLIAQLESTETAD